MYLLDILTKEHQKDLLNEAEIERKLKPNPDIESEPRPGLRNSLGNLLISGGLKLKGQHRLANKQATTL